MRQRRDPPTVVLTERRPTLCRLARRDVNFLLGRHHAHIELVPSEQRGYYRLSSRGRVGTIICPTCRLLIRPKIPLENLFYLLDPAGPVPAVSDEIRPLPGAESLDFLAGRLAHLLNERAAAGLHRAYQERADRGPFLQGQLDLSAHLRSRNGRKEQLHCRFDEFTTDISCNQIPKATAELLLRSPFVADSVRGILRRALEAFAAITSISLDRDHFPEVTTDRLTEAYQPLLDLCRILVESLGPGGQSGSTACPAFLLDMERVFEHYVTNGVARAYAARSDITVAVQPLIVANQPEVGLPDIQLRPDFTVAAGGRRFLVGDAKWKSLTGSPLVTTDLYQVISYCTALGIKRGLLIYPGNRDRAWNYSLAHAPVMVEIRTLRVRGKRESCARSLHCLAHDAGRRTERAGSVGRRK
jgi:5-methylcytosine-specific restriction enzyme subunit McrC